MLKSIITDQISMDLEEALRIAKKNGYSSVELHGVWGKSIEECSNEEVAEIKRLLKSTKMNVCDLATTVFFMCKLKPDYILKPFSPTFAVNAAQSVDEHLRLLERACVIARELDCPNIRVFPFRYPENHIVVGTDEDMALIATYFKAAMEIAAHYQVTIAVENCPYSHCPKPQMTLKVIDMVDHPQLKLLYDPANSYRALKQRVPLEYQSLSIQEEIALIKGRIAHVHLKNYAYDPQFEKPFVHVPLDHGDLDYHQILSQLQRDGYTGALSLEPEIPAEEVESQLEALNRIIDDICLNKRVQTL